MSTDQQINLRNKFESILELSQDQLTALQSGDVVRFRHALAAKGAVIESIAGTLALASTDPVIQALIVKIQDSEHESEKLIKVRLNTTRQELVKLEKAKTATRAYGAASRKTPAFIPSAETPAMFDHHR